MKLNKRPFNILVIFLVGMFLFYNLALAAYSLENLDFVYAQTGQAYSLADLDGMDMVLAQNIVKTAFADEVKKDYAPSTVAPPPTQNLTSVTGSLNTASLEYISNMIADNKNSGQLDYVKVILKADIEKQEKERGVFLTVLDKINISLKSFFSRHISRLRSFFQKPVEEIPFAKSEAVASFVQARDLEKQGFLQKAVLGYEELIKKFSGYEKIPLAKLRLAYIYLRFGNYDKSFSLYEEIIKTYPASKEAEIARIVINGLKHKDAVLEKIYSMIISSEQIFYRIGQLYTFIFNFTDAARFFQRAVALDPTSEAGIQARLNLSWLHKQQGDLDESAKELTRLLEERLVEHLSLDAQYQLANLYHAQGKYAEAVELYVTIADENEGIQLSALCLFLAGATCMYDLNNPEKAASLFARLEKEYPASPYAPYVKDYKENPIGLFLNYLVPFATKVVTWRVAGLLCLTGYSGELVKVKAKSEETLFNLSLNDWIRREFPDEVGNIYVDIKGTEVVFDNDNYFLSGTIVFGKFTVTVKAECHFEFTKDQKVMLKFTKFYFEKIPIHPALINHPLVGIAQLIQKNAPIIITNISMKEEESFAEGFTSRRLAERVKKTADKGFQGIKLEIEDIGNMQKQKEIYTQFKEDFPESDFSPSPEYGAADMYLDFFTRISLYASFKLLETVKDSKIDYERSIRTLGKIEEKEENFSVSYTDDHINASLNRLILNEFPWLIDNKFLYDVKGFEFHYKDNGEIWFDQHLLLGYGPKINHEIKVKGKMVLEIDPETELPKMLFKEITLNDIPLPVDKFNLISDRIIKMLTDAHIPFKLKKIDVYKGNITLEGKGAKDYTDRLFSDPHLFVIFQIRHWDLGVAGVQHIKRRLGAGYGDYWRGDAFVGDADRIGDSSSFLYQKEGSYKD